MTKSSFKCFLGHFILPRINEEGHEIENHEKVYKSTTTRNGINHKPENRHHFNIVETTHVTQYI